MTLTSGIIKRCIEEAEASTYRFKIGAVIFKGSRIISSGHNGIRSAANIKDKYKMYHNSLHAEQAALLNIDWNKVKGCSILVMKISSTLKQVGNALPCEMCRTILNHVDIKHIYYSNEKGEIVKYK